MKKTIEVHRFQNGNQGFHYLYGTIERDVRQTTLRYAGSCVTGPISECKVPFVFLGRSRFMVKADPYNPKQEPNQVYLASDFVIPKSVDRLITKAKEKILR